MFHRVHNIVGKTKLLNGDCFCPNSASSAWCGKLQKLWLWFTWCLVMMYVYLALGLVVSRIFVAIMLLKTKPLFILTKELVYFLSQKYNQIAPLNVCGVCAQFSDQIKYLSVSLNASLTVDDDIQETSEIAVLCSKHAQRRICFVLSCSKHSVSYLSHANVCLPIVANTHRRVWRAYELHTLMPTGLCIA